MRIQADAVTLFSICSWISWALFDGWFAAALVDGILFVVLVDGRLFVVQVDGTIFVVLVDGTLFVVLVDGTFERRMRRVWRFRVLWFWICRSGLRLIARFDSSLVWVASHSIYSWWIVWCVCYWMITQQLNSSICFMYRYNWFWFCIILSICYDWFVIIKVLHTTDPVLH